jgi:hypothetical protein
MNRAQVPLLVWAVTSGPDGSPGDGVFLSYKLGQMRVPLRPPRRRNRSRLGHSAR